MILLKRLLLELDIWVLHMPSLNHQSLGWGGWGVQNRSKCSLPELGRGCCSTDPRLQLLAPHLQSLPILRGGARAAPSTSLAPKGFPAAFLQIQVSFQGRNFWVFPHHDSRSYFPFELHRPEVKLICMDYRKTMIPAPNTNSHPVTVRPPKAELQDSFSTLCSSIFQIILSEHFQHSAL